MQKDQPVNFADLEQLKRKPEVAYDRELYEQLREEASARNGGLVDPRELHRYSDVYHRRGRTWCQSVIGFPITGGPGTISVTASNMLLLADERGLEPPEPEWLTRWHADSAAHAKAVDERSAEYERRQQEKSAQALAALAAALIDAEVRVNPHSMSVRDGRHVHLAHIVPARDVRSARRLHPAGIPLCEAPDRYQPRRLADPDGSPATCIRCLDYADVVRPVCDYDTVTTARPAKCGKAAQYIWHDTASEADRLVCGTHVKSVRKSLNPGSCADDVLRPISAGSKNNPG
jgi:hypothetical protein